MPGEHKKSSAATKTPKMKRIPSVQGIETDLAKAVRFFRPILESPFWIIPGYNESGIPFVPHRLTKATILISRISCLKQPSVLEVKTLGGQGEDSNFEGLIRDLVLGRVYASRSCYECYPCSSM